MLRDGHTIDKRSDVIFTTDHVPSEYLSKQ